MKQEILLCDCILRGRRQKQRGAIMMGIDNLQEVTKIASDQLRSS